MAKSYAPPVKTIADAIERGIDTDLKTRQHLASLLGNKRFITTDQIEYRFPDKSRLLFEVTMGCGPFRMLNPD
jgi:hypothetical protein